MTQMHKKCKIAKNAKTAKKNITQMRSFLQNRKKWEREITTFCFCLKTFNQLSFKPVQHLKTAV